MNQALKVRLTRIINDYARKMNAIKDNDSNLSGDDVREGLDRDYFSQNS